MPSLVSLFGDDASVLREQDFQLLLLANTLPPLGSALVSPVLDSLIDPFGITAAEVGLMMSFFTAPSIVVIPIAGVLADRIGRKPMLIGGLVVFGLAGTAIALTTDYRTVLALRLVQGIGFASSTPIVITSIGDLYEGTEEATAQGLRFTGSGLSQTVFPLLGGVLVALAWQYPFFLYALSIPVAILLWARFDEPAALDETGDSGDGEAGNGAGLRGHSRSLLALLVQRRVFAMVIARGLPVVVWIGFLTYNSIIVVQFLDGSPAEAGLLAGVGSLVYAGAATQAGRITARFDSRLVPLIAANLSLGGGLVLAVFAPTLPVAGAGLVLMGIGFGVTLSIYRSIITGLAPTALRGGIVSLSESFGRVGATATPVAMGLVIARLRPVVGFQPAVQAAAAGAAAVATFGGIACMIAVSTAPPVRPAVDSPAD